ncbi:MAG: hypothetical protein ACK5H1_10335 [Tenacibaculum sp.]
MTTPCPPPPALTAVIVKRQVLLAVFLLSVLASASAQISKYSLFALAKAGKSEIDSVSSPSKGSLVYNTDDNQIYMHNGTEWKPVHKESTASVYGDIKYGVQTSDHLGWYILDGRPLTELSKSAQEAAISLGLSDSLPDARGRFLKSKSDESLLTKAGQSSYILNQENLPNVNFEVTTSSNGGHSHSGTTSTNGKHGHNYSKKHNHKVKGLKGGNDDFFLIGDHITEKISDGGAHNHSFTTNSSGNHSHNISVVSGGLEKPINNQPFYLVTHTFIYLGE